MTEIFGSTECECCGEPIHFINIDADNIEYDRDHGWLMNLSTDEVLKLQAQLKDLL
jgi:hypothetical protein